MSWPKGKPRGKKTGGRKPCTPNKKTVLLQSAFDELCFSIPDEIVKVIPALTPYEKAKVLLELMSYLYPKRKPSDPSSETPKPEGLTTTEKRKCLNRLIMNEQARNIVIKAMMDSSATNQEVHLKDQTTW